MEFKGKIIAVVEPKSGTTARGAWKMQQFVAESRRAVSSSFTFRGLR
jgi:hypothetical protein